LANYAGKDIAQAFIIASIEYLSTDGLLTAIVPLSLLKGANNQKFRRILSRKYTIQKVVEVAGGSLSPALGADLAVIQIRKQQNSDTPTDFVILQEPESSDLNVGQNIIEQRSLDLESQNILGDYTLAPSEVIRIHQITDELSSFYPQTECFTVIDPVKQIIKGSRVDEKDLRGEGHYPYFKISHANKEQSIIRFSQNSRKYTIADPSDLLISAAGTVTTTHIPERQLIPDQNWAVVQFDSREAAIVYDGFFKTKIGRELLEAVATGESIPYIPLKRFRRLPVPVFDDDQITAISDRLKMLNYDRTDIDQEATEAISEIFIEVMRE